jgi:hypothetical protein
LGPGSFQHAIGKNRVFQHRVFEHGILRREILVAAMDTTKARAGEVQTENKALEKIKKAAFSRGLLELFRHPRCPALTVWALSAQGAS